MTTRNSSQAASHQSFLTVGLLGTDTNIFTRVLLSVFLQIGTKNQRLWITSPSNASYQKEAETYSQGKLNQSSTSTSSTNHRNSKAQAQTHPNKPVVTPNKTNTSQASSSAKTSNQSPAIDTTYVTSVNSTSFPNNVLPTATLNVRYRNKQVNVRAFFDTGSHRSFISP